MFEGFAVEDLAVGDAVIHVRHAGRGRAVLLLHGHPRTGATWHRIAPALVELGFRVVVPDLRGQGASRGPAPAADHAPASKRAMGRDLVAVMDALGIGRFSIAGHDRGSYVAYRMAMDHPRRLNRLALLDCLPIVEHLERTDEAFAAAWWHWFFYAQPDIPERVINADPEAWYHGDPERMGRKIEVPLLPARRPRTAARRSGGDLARMGRGRERPWHRFRAPYGRGRAGGAHRGARRVLRGRPGMTMSVVARGP